MTLMLTAAELAAKIENAYTELRHREIAARYLKGIPALQNQSSISRLYDTLNHLHIAKIESECA